MRNRIAVLGVLAALLWAAAPPDDGGSQLDAAGWWWSAQAGLVDLPPPPSVPEDGLMVGNGLNGPTAIAAVRYELGDEDASAATLTLEVANEQGGEAAAISACPAIARWRGAHAGAWEHRPTADCDAGAVAGVRDEEGETWTFDLSLLTENGWVNVILQPGVFEGAAVPDGETPDQPPAGTESAEEGEPTPPFQIAFEPPEDGSMVAGSGFGDFDADAGDFEARGPDESAGTTDEVVAGPPAPSPQGSAPLDMGSAPSSPPGSGSAMSDAPPPDIADADRAEDRDEPVALVAPDVSDGSQVGDDALAMAPVAFGQDRIRQVAALIGLACAVAAMMLWRAPAGMGLHGLKPALIVRPEQAAAFMPGLGSGADGEKGPVGGLGRFAKPRQGEPPPL